MKKHALVCNLMYKLDSFEARGDLIGLLKYVQYVRQEARGSKG